MNTTESTKAFLPLSIENDTHFNCTETFTPSISWQYTDKTDKAPTQWTGHLRIPADGVYTISANIDDNGFIEIAGVKVINLEGHNSVRTLSAQVELKAGYHRIVLQHQDLAPLNPDYANAMEFTPKLNNQPMVVHKIMAPINRMTCEDANLLKSKYDEICHRDVPATAPIWEIAGPSVAEFSKGGSANTCALRVSLALGAYGVELQRVPMQNSNGAPYLGPIARRASTNDSDNEIYPVGIPLFIRAEELQYSFGSLIGALSSDYEEQRELESNKLVASAYSLYCNHLVQTQENEDVVLWFNYGDTGVNHVAMGANGEGDSSEGGFTRSDKIWVLYSPYFENCNSTMGVLSPRQESTN